MATFIELFLTFGLGCTVGFLVSGIFIAHSVDERMSEMIEDDVLMKKNNEDE